ncbi:unnamed protein product [Gordionus sp. m RMFG-2023]|uniref:uncharacterized protein LOC135930819 n=1 Tax=Gordionus sp. m RMFG-2023 TaxID=3053472 RepID=UPI0030E418EC
MDKFGAIINMSPITSGIQNSDLSDKNKAPKMKCNKTFIPKATNLSPKKNATTDDDDDIAYAKYGAKFWDQPTYIVSHSNPGNSPLIFEAPKMELFLKAKNYYDMAAPIFKICDLEHRENQQIFTSFYIYYTQLLEALKI